VTKQAEHRKSRRRLGLCAVEGCKERTGDKFRCKAHSEAHAVYQRGWRRERQRQATA